MTQAVSDAASIGSRLNEVRADEGLSQAEFAQRLGISLRAFQSYERAERELPFSVAVQLFREFGINPLWLALGPELAARKALSADDSARLCSDLYETWQKAVEALPVDVSYEVRKTLHRKLARSTFRQANVPLNEISETVEDLKP